MDSESKRWTTRWRKRGRKERRSDKRRAWYDVVSHHKLAIVEAVKRCWRGLVTRHQSFINPQLGPWSLIQTINDH